jgi:hypothetical protein
MPIFLPKTVPGNSGFLDFGATDTVSGMLDEGETYRLCATADCWYTLSSLGGVDVVPFAASLLPKDTIEMIDTRPGRKCLSARGTTASGQLIRTKMGR